MTEVKLPFSHTVYRVDEEKYFQKNGQKVQLTISAYGFELVQEDGTVQKIAIDNVSKVDLTNILSKAYFTIYANSEKIILTYVEPLSVGEKFRPAVNNALASLDQVTTANWIKQAVNQILSPGKIVQRKELRLVRTAAIGVAIPVILIVLFFLVLKD